MLRAEATGRDPGCWEDSDVPEGVRSGLGRGTLLLADISGYTAFLQAVGKPTPPR